MSGACSGRGPVPFNTLRNYTPTLAQQYDPADFTNRDNVFPRVTPTPGVTPVAAGPQARRQVAKSNRSVLWAAPYTGQVVVGPGTIPIPPRRKASRATLIWVGGYS
jgi:hypothetical protein